MTFGITAERAATEYGYINPREVVSGEVRTVAEFVQKPDAAKAAEYIKAGYLWNSGNFMFRASVLLDEYRKFGLEASSCRQFGKQSGTLSRLCHTASGGLRFGEG